SACVRAASASWLACAALSAFCLTLEVICSIEVAVFASGADVAIGRAGDTRVAAAISPVAFITLRFGINNIGNRQPPFLNFGNDANTDTSTYRLLGRTFSAS